MLGELANLDRSGLAQVVDQLQPARAGQGLEKRGLKGVDTLAGADHGFSPPVGVGARAVGDPSRGPETSPALSRRNSLSYA